MFARTATLSDISELCKLEQSCWASHLQASEDRIKSRLLRNPGGQFVVLDGDRLCGVLYTQLISSSETLIKGTFATQEDLLDLRGSTLQLMSIAVQGVNGGNPAAFLRDYALQVAKDDANITSVVAMTRCSAYAQQSTGDYNRYVLSCKDPTIFFHVSGGATIEQIVENYRPEDRDNLGCAILIRYSLDACVNAPTSGAFPEKSEEFSAPIASTLLEDICKKLIEINPQCAFVNDLGGTPLMTVIDSLQVLVLHSWLETRLSRDLSPTFLFNYTTPKSIINGIYGSSVASEINSYQSSSEPLAIIGTSCKFPGEINSLHDMWRNIVSKACASSEVPFDRWDLNALDLEKHGLDPSRQSCVNLGSFLSSVAQFDPTFFGMGQSEAENVDPHQRLVLEMAVRALADSNMSRDKLEGQCVGVWVGMSGTDVNSLPGCGLNENHTVYSATGSSVAVTAGRLSYLLGLRGPAMVVDTACSSSLVALNQACEALRTGKCNAAVVSAVNLILTPWTSVAYARAGMTSPDGKCHTFDESANGYCRAEGCGALVLKRLSDAERDNDGIYAVVRGSAVMQDGKSASLTAPNGLAQEQLLRAALSDAGVDADDVSLIEAHGTGTKLGDPIETEALSSVYGHGRSEENTLYVSSVKANIGHMEAAAGIGGILSAILALHYKQAPPNAQLRELNSKVAASVSGSPISFPTEPTPLVRHGDRPLLAGVSSFGYSGTISHVILEEAPVSHSRSPGIISSSQFASDTTSETCIAGMVWQFAGQGTLSVGVLRDMYESESTFRDAMSRCDDILRSHLGVGASELLYPGICGGLTEVSAAEHLSETVYSQPILVALEYCLSQVWLSRGIRPAAVMGHSLGEYAAAIVSGVLSLEDSLRLVCIRGRLMQESDGCVGCMYAVRATADEVISAISDSGLTNEVSVAAVNGPRSVVISGSVDGVQKVLNSTGLMNMSHRQLKVSRAFHSPLMADIISAYEKELLLVQFNLPTIKFVSTVTGHYADEELMSSSYWLKHILQPVLYESAVEVCFTGESRDGDCVFVEMGADLTLSRLGGFVCNDAEFVGGWQYLSSLIMNGWMYCPIFVPYKLPCHRLLSGRSMNWRSNSAIHLGKLTPSHTCFRKGVFELSDALETVAGAYMLSNYEKLHKPVVFVTIRINLLQSKLFSQLSDTIACELYPSSEFILSVTVDGNIVDMCNGHINFCECDESHVVNATTTFREPVSELLEHDLQAISKKYIVFNEFSFNKHLLRGSVHCTDLVADGYSLDPIVLDVALLSCSAHFTKTMTNANSHISSCDEVLLRVNRNFLSVGCSEVQFEGVVVDITPTTSVYNVIVRSYRGDILATLTNLTISNYSDEPDSEVYLCSSFVESEISSSSDMLNLTSVLVVGEAALSSEINRINNIFSFKNVDYRNLEVCCANGKFDVVVMIIDQKMEYSMSSWLGALECICATSPNRVLCVTVGGNLPSTSVVPALSSSCIAGALKCAVIEYPKIDMVVVNADCTVLVPESVCKVIQNELAACQGELEVKYHKGYRHVRRYTTLNLPTVTHKGICDMRLTNSGTYVITGGLGGLGLLTARILAGHGASRLVLLSRSGKVSYTGQGLESELEWLQKSSGSEVHVMCCDVSDESSVVDMLREVREMGGGIRGIIHAAGVLRDALIRGGGAASGCADVWASKAHSAWLLHKHTLDDSLSLFVVYSSIISAIGNIGQSAYGAANSFLDELIEYRVDRGLCGIGIQWPAITGIGMAAAAGIDGYGLSADPKCVEQVLRYFLLDPNRAGGVVTVAPRGMGRWMSNRIRQQFEDINSLVSFGENISSKSLINKTTSNSTRINRSPDDVVLMVRSILESLLGVSGVSEGVQVMDLGLDSLAVTELASKLSNEFGIRVLPTLVFKYPTLGDITTYVLEQLGLSASLDIQAPSTLQETDSNHKMSIVGVSCRLPGDVRDLNSLWNMLSERRDATSTVSVSRWDTDFLIANSKLTDPSVLNRVRYGGFMSDEVLEGFNPSLFGISEAEASRMDPRHRLLLECTYESLVDAGYDIVELKGKRVGVFIGVSGNCDHDTTSAPLLSAYDATSNALSVAAGRISYVFGFQGPCCSIDTACSSSLVALHTASRCLEHNECDIAVVSAVCVLTSDLGVSCAVAGMTSPDGKCHTFDESANGYCRAEGCGALVLKRLSDAERDNDGIYAVVRGSAVMQDGKSASLTAPNGLAQEQLLRAALSDAGVDAGDVSLIEAHGTGTKLGDPIETEALSSVYGHGRSEENTLYVSGVKANIGHMEAAAGIGGILSAILALHYKQAPPNAQLRELNSKVAASVSGSPISFPTEPTPLVRHGDRPLLAGVSSFGYSGTISHVILEEAPVSHSRSAGIISSSQFASDTTSETCIAGMVWQFAGQGTLSVGVLRDMYESESTFRDAMSRCDDILRSHLGVGASELLYPGICGGLTEVSAAEHLSETVYSQPILVALEYCLSQVWLSRGIRPAAVMGHSLGEYAAAIVSGVLSLEDSLRLVCIRGRLMQESDGCVGCMYAVRATADEVISAISDSGLTNEVSVAAVNGPRSVVVSGSVDGVQKVLNSTGLMNMSHRQLKVSRAFHSPLMTDIISAYEKELLLVQFNLPTVKFVSTVTGHYADEELISSSYWLKHILQPVLYESAVEVCFTGESRDGDCVFVEMGADKTLSRLGERIAATTTIESSTLSFFSGTEVERYSTLKQAVSSVISTRQTNIKLYKMRKSFHRLFQFQSLNEMTNTITFNSYLHVGILEEWLRDHVLHNDIVFPGAGMIDMAIAAVIRETSTLHLTSALHLEALTITRPIVVTNVTRSDLNSAATRMWCVSDGNQLEWFSNQSDSRVSNARCSVSLVNDELSPDWHMMEKRLETIRSLCTDEVDVGALYSRFSDNGLFYGPKFRLATAVRCDSSMKYVLSRISTGDIGMSKNYVLPPPLLDAALQTSAAYAFCNNIHGAQIPYAIDHIWFRHDKLLHIWLSDWCEVVVEVRECTADMSVFNITLFSASGHAVLYLEGLYSRSVHNTDVDVSTPYSQLSSHWIVSSTDPGRCTNSMSSCLVVGDSTSYDSLVGDDALPDFPSHIELYDLNNNEKPLDQSIQLKEYDLVILCLNSVSKHHGCVDGGEVVATILSLLDICCGLTTRLMVVAVDSSDERDITLRSLAGAMRCAQLEYPTVDIELVDTDICSAHSAVRTELLHFQSEIDVKYRDGVRSVKRYEPLELCRREMYDVDDVAGGTFIITGGLGGLGLLTARILAGHGASRLVLLSRSGKVSYTGQGLESELEWLQKSSGSEVHVMCCDVSDESSVVDMLREVREMGGGIRGIIHAAGVLRDALIRGGGAASGCADVWASKAHSAWLLHKHTLDDSLSLFVVYSSIASAIGNIGQSAYGAANSFLDELIEYRVDRGLCGIGIQWPAITGIGMAAAAGIDGYGLSADPKCVEQVLRYFLLDPNRAGGVVTVAPRGMGRWMSNRIRQQFEDINSLVSFGENISSKSLINKTTSNSTRINRSPDDVVLMVRSILESLLGVSGVSEGVQVMDLGLDSLAVTELASKLSNEFGIRVLPTLVFKYPTLGDITTYVLEQLGLSASLDIQAPSTLQETDSNHKMSIVGVSCRLPGDVRDLNSLWNMLSERRDATSTVSVSRWDTDFLIANSKLTDPSVLNRVRYGGFMSDEVLEGFNPSLFGISEAEASRMDPSQRLLLECTYESLVDAGYDIVELKGKRVGVFIGIMGDIIMENSCSVNSRNHSDFSVYDVTRRSLSVAAGRISYVFGFQGPCCSIDTACSSSLVALHTASRCLEHNECDIAVVSAVCVLTSDLGVSCAVAGMTSPDGKCHTFDESANGYCRAEGCGALVLKRLSDAERDNDGIYAVVRGSAVMQDGKSASLTAPNGLAQEQLLRAALSDAGVDAGDVSLIEAHGTGTKLGDPIETEALSSVYGHGRSEENTLYVSGVKANIGHMEAAAGIGGILSAILALHYKQAPPNAQLRELNSKVAASVSGSPISFPTEPTPLVRHGDRPLLAGVSSFGFSGTISHVILEEAPISRNRGISDFVQQDLNKNFTVSKRFRFHRLLCLEENDSIRDHIIYNSYLHVGILEEWLRDHVLHNDIVFPGAGMIDMAIAAVIRETSTLHLTSALHLEALTITRPIVVTNVTRSDLNSAATRMWCVSDGNQLEWFSNQSDSRVSNARCSVSLVNDELSPDWHMMEKRLETIRSLCTDEVDVGALYSRFSDNGLFYGPKFRLATAVRCDSSMKYVLSRISTGDIGMSKNYVLPPPLLDAALQTSAAYAFCNNIHGAQIPYAIDHIWFRHDKLLHIWLSDWCEVVVEVRECTADMSVFNITLFSASGHAVLYLEGLYSRSVHNTDVDVSTPYSQLSSHWIVSSTDPGRCTNSMSSCLVVGDSTSYDSLVGDDALPDFPSHIELYDLNNNEKPLDQSIQLKEYDLVILCLNSVSKHHGCVDGGEVVATILSLLDICCGLTTRLMVVAVDSSDERDITLRSLAGAMRCAQLEYPTVDIELVDTDICSAHSAVRTELLHFQSEIDVKYRDGVRSVKRYEPLELCRREMYDVDDVAGGTFIITGGLGGLGLLTARILAGHGASRLVLLSRSGKVSYTGQGLESELEWLQKSSGSEVHVMCCDVSDESSVVDMLREVREMGGGIRGIIHAAGVLRDALIRGGGAASGCADVWASKAHSAWLLHKHTLDDSLSLFVVYSSIASAIGNIGQSAYGAANSFLDELIEYRVDRGLCGIGIQWPAITGIGMAAAVGGMDAGMSIDPSSASRILDTMIGACQKNGVITVLPRGADAWMSRSISAQFKSVSRSNSRVVSLRSSISKTITKEVNKGWSKEEVVRVVRSVVESLLEMTGVSEDDQVMDMGLDSLAMTELASTLASEFGVRVLPTLVFNYPTLREITGHIIDLLGLAESITTAESPDSVLPYKYNGSGNVAIVGVSCRLPGNVNNLESMWSMLCEGRDMTSTVSLDRWDVDSLVAHSSWNDPSILERTRYGGFLSDDVLESFDASLFGISDAEASCMDPSQRLLLECTHEALRDAGYDISELKGENIGVFVGMMGSTDGYGTTVEGLQCRFPSSVYDASSNTLSVCSGRLSYVFGFQGPCCTVDTACSSTVVGLHLAIRSLNSNECTVAIVAGANLLSATSSISAALARMTSPDGKCHTFDESANGYCRAEGCGALVLKRLSDAERDNDGIYAVVRGSAVMQDGKSASLTAPNGLAQEQLLRAALSDAGVDAGDVSLIEAHGTGTKLGDPIETEALSSVYGHGRSEENTLYVSGVKANIGHMEAAAGIGGILSAILALHYKQAPPNAQLRELNSKVAASVSGSPISFPTEPTPLVRHGDRPLLAGVSSFGYSGTISHVILEEAPVSHSRSPGIISSSQFASDTTSETCIAGMVWQFAGQGTLSVGVLRDMYESESTFRDAMSRCDDILRSHLGVGASELLYPGICGGLTEVSAAEYLSETAYSQPILVALEYCLSQVWLSRGIRPAAVMGHSLGEYAAAIVSGVLSLEDSLRLVCIRGRLMQESDGCVGCMYAVRATADEVISAISDSGLTNEVSVAAVNGPRSVVVSGSVDGVQKVLNSTGLMNMSHRQLKVSRAFHSPLMTDIISAYEKELLLVQFNLPTVKFASTVTGHYADEELISSSYWLKHILQPVLYESAVEVCFTGESRDGDCVFVEMGADKTLSRLGERIAATTTIESSTLSFFSGTEVERYSTLKQAVSSVISTRQTNIKLYKMRKSFHRLFQFQSLNEMTNTITFNSYLHVGILEEWLRDHVLHNDIVFPGAGMIDMAIAAVIRETSTLHLTSALHLEALTITRPIVVTNVTRSDLNSAATRMWCVSDGNQLEWFSNQSDSRVSNARCSVSLVNDELSPDWHMMEKRLETIRSLCTDEVDVGALYSRFSDNGLFYGPKFRLATAVRCDSSMKYVLSRISTGDIGMSKNYVLPPPLLDAALQTSAAYAFCNNIHGAQIPYAIDHIWFRHDKLLHIWLSDWCEVVVEVRECTADMSVFNITLFSASGHAVLYLEGLYSRSVHNTDVDVSTPYSQLSSHWIVSSTDPGRCTNSMSSCLVVGDSTSYDSLVGDDALPDFPSHIELYDLNNNEKPLDQSIQLKEYDLVILCLNSVSKHHGCVDGGEVVATILSLLDICCGLATRLMVVAVDSSDERDITLRSLAGAMRCAQLEYPTVDIELVDTDICSAHSAVRTELLHFQSEIDVKYRDGVRSVKRYEPLELCRREMYDVDDVAGGTFIITGGLGGLGLLTARILAGHGASRLVLLSRSGKVSYTGQGLESELEWLQKSSGSEVHVMCCDVSDESSVVDMLREVREMGGGIRGIIHAAGVLRDALIRGGGAASGCADVWASKAHSAWLLHKHTLDDSLSLFVVYSSIASAIGNIGQSAYGAANSFLDELIEYRVDRGLCGIGIQWPAITGIGMAAAVGGMDAGMSIDSSSASRILDTMIGACQKNGVITVLPRGADAWMSRSISAQFKSVSRSNSRVVSLRSSISKTITKEVNKGWSKEEVVRVVRSVVESLLEMTGVSEDDQVMDMGLDSLAMTELASTLASEFGVRVLPTLVFNYPTLREITGHIIDLLGLAESITTAESPDSVLPYKYNGSGNVAIVGVSCRLPGNVNNLESMWSMLCEGRDMTSTVSLDRWDVDSLVAHSSWNDPSILERTRYGGFLSDDVLESFDASLFGISDAEASCMDPSQRLLLECTHEALRDAGYDISELKGENIGVFVGMMGATESSVISGFSEVSDSISVYDVASNSLSACAGKISYCFGLQGPCCTIDTACSSVSVALHYACASLARGDCTAAVVAGSNTIGLKTSVLCAVAGMTSPDGKCHTFDESANGYCRAEGCGALVLKRLSDAERDNDGIYAVVRGSAVMQDGKSASLTAPNGLAQEQLLRAALSDAGVDAGDVSLIEAHGTGTKLGDPIETEALSSVYGHGRSEENTLYVSGVKANIGHMEAAAGIGGILSAILALHYKQAPPNAQLRELNSKVAASVSGSPISFPTEPTPLVRHGDRPLLAGVSSFGYSGTISHVILEEAPVSHSRSPGIISSSQFASDTTSETCIAGMVWQFAGQGTLSVGVLRDMYESESTFRDAMSRCDDILRSHLGVGASELLYPGICGGLTEVSAAEYLSETAYSQPILVALEYCLSQVWLSRGIRPAAVMGHSLGEYAAAIVSGVLSLEDSLRLVCFRFSSCASPSDVVLEYEKALMLTVFRQPTTRVISPLTGSVVDDIASLSYWHHNSFSESTSLNIEPRNQFDVVLVFGV